MYKTKILAFITLFLVISAFTPAFAAGEISLSEATFEAEDDFSSETQSDVAELRKTIELLRIELGEMKSGMKQLQAKMVEAEMDKLRSQLDSLQKEIKTGETEDTEVPALEVFSVSPAPETPQITKIEDFLNIDLKEVTAETEEVKSETIEDLEAAEVTNDETVTEDAEVEDELDEKDVEIAELKAALALKEEKEAHAEVKEKADEIKATKAELEKVAITDAVNKLTGEEEPSNIIAQANGEILFQFPRSVSQKKGKTQSIKNLSAGSLTASILNSDKSATEENSFKRKSAPKTSFSMFSTSSITIFGGMLGVAVVVFIFWLVRHERKLLAATSRRFRQLDFKPDFNLRSRAKKMFKRDKSSSDEDNITQ
jgi:hypothetical protein